MAFVFHDGTQKTPSIYKIRYENLMGAANSNLEVYAPTFPVYRLKPPSSLAGCRFAGWYDAPAGGQKITSVFGPHPGGYTLYARWEPVFHTLVYRGNAAPPNPARGVPGSFRVREGYPTLLTDCIPARPGFRFLGWNTRPDGSGSIHHPGELITLNTEDLTLYAVWERCAACQ